ncbi:TRAP transporter small permease [Amaricoccus macauensis]|uniref:TRAP transporter small permease n=1 Tax=Amaricoccus macauensis TaxID=57001 RepID=UPI003C7D5B9A
MKAIERLMLEFATLSAILLAIFITAAVVSRQVFGTSLPDVVIIVRELMIPTILLPMAAATTHRAHIAVTFVTDRASPGLRGALIVFGWVFALLAMVPLIYASYRSLASSWSSGEFYDGILGIKRWPMKAVFLIGLVMMAIRLALIAVEDFIELRRTGTVRIESHIDEEAI